MTHIRSVAAMAGAAILLSTIAASADEGPTGTWSVKNGVALIRIVDCGGKYWGVVAWEKSPGVDSHNPNSALRSRPTLGMPVLLGMSADGANQWSGRIYNSEDGQTYDSHIRLTGANALRVEGCIFGFLCGGETWTRSAAAAPVVAQNRHPHTRATTGAGASSRPSIAQEPAAKVCSGLGRG